MQPTLSAVPLQFGWPLGGVEALVLALLTFVIPVFLALWVLIDAKAQTDHPLAWGLTVLLGGLTPFYVGAIAVTILYHLSREELGSIPPPSVTKETVGRGEVLGNPAREHAGGSTESGGGSQNVGRSPAARHEEQHGSDTVTGMGPDGQARWDGRAAAGLGVNGGADAEETQESDAGYDDATSMAEGEWSDEPASADGGSADCCSATDEQAVDEAAEASESSPADIGGFEMADPIEDTEAEPATDG